MLRSKETSFIKHLKVIGDLETMFPLCNFNFVYFKVCFMLKFVFSMSNATTDDCGQVPYETGCLVESLSVLKKD